MSIVPTEGGGVNVSVDGSSLTEVFEKATHYSTLKFTEPTLKETCNVYCTSVEDPHNIWVQLGNLILLMQISIPQYKYLNRICTFLKCCFKPFNLLFPAEYEEELGTVMGALATYCPDAPAVYTHVPG